MLADGRRELRLGKPSEGCLAEAAERAGGAHYGTDRQVAVLRLNDLQALELNDAGVLRIERRLFGHSRGRAADVEPRQKGYTGPVRSHEWIDRRSLALHEAVAAKLEAHPELLDIARRNLERWLQTSTVAALREWRGILDGAPLSDVLALLRSPNEEAARLRQSSPFAGLLTPEERRTIMAAYESRRP